MAVLVSNSMFFGALPGVLVMTERPHICLFLSSEPPVQQSLAVPRTSTSMLSSVCLLRRRLMHSSTAFCFSAICSVFQVMTLL